MEREKPALIHRVLRWPRKPLITVGDRSGVSGRDRSSDLTPGLDPVGFATSARGNEEPSHPFLGASRWYGVGLARRHCGLDHVLGGKFFFVVLATFDHEHFLQFPRGRAALG